MKVELSWFISIPVVKIGFRIDNLLLPLDSINWISFKFLITYSWNILLLEFLTIIYFFKAFRQIQTWS